MPRFYPRRTPRNETPEQIRARQDREEIAKVRTISRSRNSLDDWKRNEQQDWEIAHGRLKPAA